MTKFDSKKSWGRNEETSLSNILFCGVLFTTTPLLVMYFISTALYCKSDLFGGILCLYDNLNDSEILTEVRLIKSILMGTGIVISWIGLQVMLALLPDFIHKWYPSYNGGMNEGLITPGGHIYKYNINGLQAWIISVILFTVCSYCELFSATIIYDYWGMILFVAAVLSYILTVLAYVKAHKYPTNLGDCKFTNSKFYDCFMGVELNPRSGPLDWKLFFNGRPGIVGWSLINLSFAAAQYHYHGYITNSMILVNFLHNLYIGYFFYREAWYLKTLDISHDHFGWMFAFGDLVWLPAMYTLQGLYLVNNPVNLSLSYFLFVLLLGCGGFYIFAASNNEKDKFRSKTTRNNSVKTIICRYTTADGKTHTSDLLVSGWWGICRHINYTGDIILSLAYSLACGSDNIFPYFYVLYLTALLIHRTIRDDKKCRDKYGTSWQLYCDKVPYLFIPYII